MRVLAILLVLAACNADVGVVRVTQQDWIRAARRNVLSSDDVSDVTRSMLRRRGFADDYRQDPPGVISKLVDEIRETHSRDLAVAIAELGYLQTRRVATVDRTALGTTLRYGYAYLFDPKLEPGPQRFDAQFRWACDLYNYAIAEFVRLSTHESRTRNQTGGELEWYGGEANLEIGRNELDFDLTEFDAVHVAYDYRVEGLPPRSAQPARPTAVATARRPR